jgi:integrase
LTLLASILADHGLWAAIRRDVQRLDKNESAGRALLPDEESRLLQAASQVAARQGHWSPIYAVTVLGLNTGLRHSEVRRLRWQGVDLERRVLVVGKSKSDSSTGRPVPINSPAWAALSLWEARFPNRKPSDYVFPVCENGNIAPSRPIAHWRTAWNRACQLA